MLPFAFYLLKVTICSGILFGYYWFILRNKIFHQYNRFYLLASVVLSLVLPLIQINIWHNADQPAPQAIKLLQAVDSDGYLDEIIVTSQQTGFSSEQLLVALYVFVSFAFFIFFINAMARIHRLFKQHRYSLVENIFFVNTTAKGTPFSFLKFIFWNDHIDPESPAGNQVFRHELAHVKQKHSYDKLLMHIVLIFFWCNPFFWLLRKELNMIHEFVADQIAVEDNDTAAFAAMILQAAYPQQLFHLTNPFFYSPIKRRLMMLTKNRNPKVGYIGRLLVLPLTVLVFAAFTLKAKTFKQNNRYYDGKTITVVIDAGHGGTDIGATNSDRTVFEKDLNLAITKKINALNTNQKIRIMLTRETDVFQTLQEKVAFTKAAHADLFISIHMDAFPATESNPKSGMSIHVANDQAGNTSISKMLASVLIDEFNTQYGLPVSQQPIQSKMTIRVLQDATCPAVLIEAGNITNSKDLSYLQTAAAKEMIAGKILTSIEKWASAKEKGETGAGTLALTTTTSSNVTAVKLTDTLPEIQLKNQEKALIIADGKTISQEEFKKIKPENIESISVVKNGAELEKYGEKGKNGVVIIETKMQERSVTNIRIITNQTDSSSQVQLTNIQKNLNGKNTTDGTPLYVIDGKMTGTGFKIDNLSPGDIEAISVLKGTGAIEKYGQTATNGVIEITTRSKENAVNVNGNNSKLNEVVVVGYANNKSPDQNYDKVFTKAENGPQFPGGDSAWRKYLMKHLNFNIPSQDGWKSGEYRIVVSFIVRADGTVADIRTNDFAGSKTAEHCIDLIRKGPKWEPATQNGQLVNAYRKQPITFRVEAK